MDPSTSPTEAGTIWRYMDFPKFVSMIATGTLWFAKAATFSDDPYEGFGRAKFLKGPFADDLPKAVIRKAADGAETRISVIEMMANWSERSARAFERAREHLYVSSWCEFPSESMAMWQIYGGLGSGVAVKSSVERFEKAVKFNVDDSYYEFGSVHYHERLDSVPELSRDFRSGEIPVEGPGLRGEALKIAFHKRSCFHYEQEWRAAVYQDLRPEINGLAEICDLDQLVSAVYVGPRAQSFMFDAVQAVMDKFSFRKDLVKSQLLRAPEMMAGGGYS